MRAGHRDDPEQLAAVSDRSTRVAAEPPRPTSCGSQMSSQVPPLMPARAITGSSLAPMVIGAAWRWGTPVATRSTRPVQSTPRRTPAPSTCAALGELEEQLVHRDRAGQPLTECAQRLVGGDPLAVDETVGAFSQPAPSRQVEQRSESGGDHRQQQQCAFVVRRGAAEAEDDDDVDGDDERRQPGDSDGVGEQAIDPGDHPWQRPAGEADGDEAGESEGDGTGVVGPAAEQPEGDDDDGGLGGHRHAPADPLHAAPVLSPGLDARAWAAYRPIAKAASQNTTSGSTTRARLASRPTPSTAPVA